MRTQTRNLLTLLLLLTGLTVLGVGSWYARVQPLRLNLDYAALSWTDGDYWLYPLESHVWKRPVGDFSGVYALPDGQQVWAVGADGLILHSTDGGKTWDGHRKSHKLESGFH